MKRCQVVPPTIPDNLVALCDRLELAVSFADAACPEAPLIYVNQAFAQLFNTPRRNFIGHNCRFVQGPLTDRTITDEMAVAVRNRERHAASLINYRSDGSPFYNLLALQPVKLPDENLLLMGCQFEFRPFHIRGPHSDVAAQIDQNWRRVMRTSQMPRAPLSSNEICRLDTLAMRFEATFTRVQNALLKETSRRTLMAYSESQARASAQGYFAQQL